MVIAFLGGPGNKEEVCTDAVRESCRLQFGDYLDWACKNCKQKKQG